MPTIQTLGTLRHACQMCGGSCNITHVPLYRDADRAGIERAREALGIEARVEDGTLLGEGGTCVFLGPDNRCRIHATLGAQHKPHVCRQWPLTAIRVGESVRVGIDPCCLTHGSSWKTAPALDAAQMSVSTVPVSESEAAAEAQVVALLSADGMTVGAALGILAGAGPSLPSGLADRLLGQIRALPVDRVVGHEDVGPLVADALTALRATADRHPSAPPWPAWSAEVDAFAVDAVRRMVWLRIATQGPGAVPVAAYGLMGALLAGWTAPDDPARATRLLACWLRLLRLPGMWALLLPDGGALQRLLRG